MNKYFVTPLRKRLTTLWVDSDKIEKWEKDWKFFFILGFGRSGTAFLSNLLDKCNNAHVFHEPVLEDFYAHMKAHYNQQDAEYYMQGFRKKEMYIRTRRFPPSVYGEVNGTLRCHVKAIGDVFPEATFLHLVRDGRDVVRSHVSRRTMTFMNPFSLAIHPEKDDYFYQNWGKMDRFARICWYWQEENKRLRTSIGRIVQFEKVIGNYEYFSSEILGPCGIHIDEGIWRASIASPRNTTSEFSMPKWNEWTQEQKKIFTEICGDEMAKCGYEF